MKKRISHPIVYGTFFLSICCKLLFFFVAYFPELAHDPNKKNM